MHSTRSERIYQITIRIIIGAIAFSALVPLIYVVGMSITSQNELLKSNFFVLFPKNPTFEAYRRIFASPFIWKALSISVFRSVLGPLLMIIFTVMGAYVLSFKDLPLRKIFLLIVIFTIVFNGGLIPTYLVYADLRILDSLWAYLIPGMVDGFSLLIIKIAIENIPSSLTEAADLEGAGYIKRLIYVVVPCIMPTIAAMLMFSIVSHWNSWFDALVYVNNKDLYPLQMILRNMLTSDMGSNDQMNAMLAKSVRVGGESLKMATVVIGIIPIICVYPFFQRHFVAGTFAGSVKE